MDQLVKLAKCGLRDEATHLAMLERSTQTLARDRIPEAGRRGVSTARGTASGTRPRPWEEQ